MARVSKSSPSVGQKDSGNNSNPPQKRRQRQRGHPDPDAKIVALPQSMLEDEVCLGLKRSPQEFVREQDLIVHAGNHHIPDDLENNTGGRRKKAYVCPIATCRHHDPKHALSDITGIKKHFGRAHGRTKRFGCLHCNKKYAVEADFKAHTKLHHKDDHNGAGEARSNIGRHAPVRCEGFEELVNGFDGSTSRVGEDQESVAKVAGNNADGIGGNDDIFFPLGIGEQPKDIYVPKFDVAPSYQGPAAMDASASLDFDLQLLEHLPMGLTGLLRSCEAPGDKEASSVAVGANSALGLDSLFASGAAMPTAVIGGTRCPVMSSPGAVLPMADLGFSSSTYGADQRSDALNRGNGMLESVCFPGGKEQYRAPGAPTSGKKDSPATESEKGIMIGPNASMMTPGFLSSADALWMPRSATIPSMSNYCYQEGVPNQQIVSTPEPSFSPLSSFFRGAALMNVNTTTMGDGSSDRFCGFFVGSASTKQGSELGANGSPVLGLPSLSAPQQQQIAASPGLSYKSILNGITDTEPAASQMRQPWLAPQTVYTVAPPAVERAKHYSNGAGRSPRMDLFGASGEGASRRFEEQVRVGNFDPTASFCGSLNASSRYRGLQGGNPGGLR